MVTALIILGIVLAVMFWAAGTILEIKKLAKKDTHLTTIMPETGKLVKLGEDIVKVLTNMRDGHYNDKGDWRPVPKSLGHLFKELGVVFFGISPIYEIYKFDFRFSEYVEKESQEVTGMTYKIVHRKETVDSFKRYYTHAVENKKIELNDGSKIDMVVLVTFEILNIIKVIFKIKPDGIILAQAEAGIQSAINDEMRKESYQTFRNTLDKSNPDSGFVKEVISRANNIIEREFHLRVLLIEVKYYDLSEGEPGDKEFIQAQKSVELARLTGEAKVEAAKQRLQARTIDAAADAHYFDSIKKIVGEKNIGEYANLEQVKNTKLLVYNSPETALVLDPSKASGGQDDKIS